MIASLTQIHPKFVNLTMSALQITAGIFPANKNEPREAGWNKICLGIVVV
jgi:hypothetical protein